MMNKGTTNGSGDASAYKGILPAHMRQGLPPYLQILFASRPPLPFVTPVPKPHKLTIRGFFDGVDINRLRQVMEENAKRRAAEEPALAAKIPARFKRISKSEHENQWEKRMREHLQLKKAEYRNWLKNELSNPENKSGDPRKTLIVARLVV